jgi:putative intracellular protease/amidase
MGMPTRWVNWASDKKGIKMPKQILMIVANPQISTTVGGPVGLWASELFHPLHEFEAKGYAVTIASPDGGAIKFDAMSDPRDASGYSAADTLSLDYIENRAEIMAQLEATPTISGLNLADYHAIVVCGGQAPMFQFPTATGLHTLIGDFYRTGKPTAALCHGTAALLYVDDGKFVSGKTMTGFADSEEDMADSIVGQKVMPFRIEDAARAKGANFVSGPAFEPFATQDGNLITGQQQNSGAKTAELVIAALEGG